MRQITALAAFTASAFTLAALACGESSVVINVNGETDTLAITVMDENSIIVQDLNLVVGDTATLAATGLNALGQPVGPLAPTWTSSNASVASVTDSGMVVALAAGTTDITASFQSITATVPTSVTDPGGPPPPPPPPPPIGGSVHFHSNWSTGTGNSSNAFMDANKARPWTGSAGTLAPGGKSAVRVTATDGRNYPTTNYLRVHNDVPGNDNWAELYFDASDNYIPTPQVGDSIGLRYYYRVTLPNSWNNDSETHGTYFVDAGNSGYGWGPGALGMYQWTYTDGTWNYVMTMGDNVSPTANVYWQRLNANNSSAGRLQKFTTYRMEWLYIRTGTNAYQVRSRVYSVAGVLLIDSNLFVNDFWTGTATGNLANTTLSLSGAGAPYMRGFKIGVNGGITANVDFVEYAGVAICDTWCGPYPISGVEN